MRMFCLPSVRRTVMSSSSSAMERARMPVLRMFFMASSGRRLTVPLFVTMKMNMSPSSRT